MRNLLCFTVGLMLTCTSYAAPIRARELGVPFEGTAGALNAITDVAGVEVGQITLIKGEGLLRVGAGPVRTGVTIILPRGHDNREPVYGGYFNLNGNGEMTGQAYLQDFGVIKGPIGISNTNAIGQVYAGIQQWTQTRFGEAADPLVAETDDEDLNDLGGFHVTAETVIAAIAAAKPGQVQEGNVGGGTGMECFGFKGGIGTASRQVVIASQRYTIGALVQCNTGDQQDLLIAGVPVGRDISRRWLPCFDPLVSPPDKLPKCVGEGTDRKAPPDHGSIIIAVATDAPLIPAQLNRVAKRAAMGLARLGSYSGDQSGDLIVTFSTNPSVVNHPDQTASPSSITQVASVEMDKLFEATVEATEEAIVNAMVAAQTMTGVNGYRVFGLPHDELRAILKRYNRLGSSE